MPELLHLPLASRNCSAIINLMRCIYDCGDARVWA